MHEAVVALKSKGHEVVEVELPCFEEFSFLTLKNGFASIFDKIAEVFNSEKTCDNLTVMYSMVHMGRWQRWLIGKILKYKNEKEDYESW